MAKNGSKGSGRNGSVTTRTQFKHPNGTWIKRDRTTGQFLDQKSDPSPFKGIAKEPDGRQDN